MNRSRKFIIALFLLITIGMPSLVFIYYQASQAYLRFEMEEELEKEKLQTVRVPAHKVVWYKKNKEIIVDGKLFDVKTQVYAEGVVEFTGLFDEKETEIAQQLEAMKNQHSDGADDTESITVKYASIFLYKEDGWLNRFDQYLAKLIHHNQFSENHRLSPVLSIPSPPPKG